MDFEKRSPTKMTAIRVGEGGALLQPVEVIGAGIAASQCARQSFRESSQPKKTHRRSTQNLVLYHLLSKCSRNS